MSRLPPLIDDMARRGIRVHGGLWSLRLKRAMSDLEGRTDPASVKRLQSMKSYGPSVRFQSQTWDGRVRSSWSMADTGRFYASRPAIQMVTGSTYGLRDAFVPDDGNAFVNADWTSCHLWVAAAKSGEKKLLEALQNGSAYEQAASILVPEIEGPKRRRQAKISVLSMLNGGTGDLLSRTLGEYGHEVSKAEADSRVDTWLGTYSKVGRLVRNPPLEWVLEGSGRRFSGPDRHTRSSWFWQSYESEMLLAAMHLCHWPVVLSMHDGILAEVPLHLAQDAADHVAYVMDEAIKMVLGIELGDRQACKVDILPTWGGEMPELWPDNDGVVEPDIQLLCDQPYTDLGNAERFKLRYGHDVRWCEEIGKWLYWTGERWSEDLTLQARSWVQETVWSMSKEGVEFDRQLWSYMPTGDDDTDQIEKQRIADKAKSARTWAKASQASTHISAMEKEARVDSRLNVRVAQLDADPMLLGVANGTLDLTTGRVRPSRRTDYISKQIETRYDRDATCPRWLAFMGQILPDPEVRSHVQRALGYSMTGLITEQKWWMFVGQGSNGKSTMLDVVKQIFGSYGTRLPMRFLEEQKMEQHQTELMGLRGARIAFGTEPKQNSMWNSERIKAITGDGTLSARFMRQDQVEFQSTSKLFVCLNELLRTNDMGHGFWRRVVLVTFGVTFAEGQQDRNLFRDLVSERSGILNWLIDGLMAWHQDGLAIPESCRASVDEYRSDQDHVLRWTEERCSREPLNQWQPVAVVLASVAYSAYCAWHKEQGIATNPPHAVSFGKRLKKLGVGRVEGRARRGTYTGLRLLEASELEEGRDKDLLDAMASVSAERRADNRES